MKHLRILFGALFAIAANYVSAQTEVTLTDINSLYNLASGSTISIHDPSVVFRGGTYTVWGSHLGVAQSKDLVTWTPLSAGNNTFVRLAKQGDATGTACNFSTAFNTQQVTSVKNYKGETVTLPNFDAEAYAARYAADKDSWINGDMWAPDIIWNDTMKRWCMYLSINGDNWSSIIILLTATSPVGPFTYQGPVVMGGFNGQTYNGVAAPKIGETDYTIATGESSFAARYTQKNNGTYWPNCIDPCVFYDEQGDLWMSYGSWSGGIFILKLDPETGLRDYTHTYTSDYTSKGASGISDPYFGKKIAGGYYVSGEGSYIQHIGQYYYLFMSYGGFAPDGGYEMRIFRSEQPDGPYVDASGVDATYTSYQLNYGANAGTNRGMKLLGSYNGWGGLQQVGECAQGHNSACADDQGRNFVVYHTKFNDGTAGHQVRVHQLFVNQQGWLVAAPFCYRGEAQTDATLLADCPWTVEQLTGDYQILVHPYRMDHANYEEVTPSTITLTADGKVQGDLTGTWTLKDGSAHMTLKLDSTTYYGVFCQQHINGATTSGYRTTNLEAIAFTAMANNGVPVWGYKLDPASAIAWNYKQHTIPVKSGQTISQNVTLMYPTDNNTELVWTSTAPDIISPWGRYNPTGLEVATDVTLTAKLTCGDHYWTQAYDVKAQKEVVPGGDYLTGLVAFYDFDQKPTYNQYKAATETDYSRVTYGKSGNGTAPALESDYERDGQYVHQHFGAQSDISYSRVPNPLLGQTDITGFTVSMWVKRTDANMWDAIWGFFNTTTASSTTSARLFLTGNAYLGYNDAGSNWFDVNYPKETAYTDIPVGEWAMVTVTVGSDYGVRIYVNGTNKTAHSVAASDGTTVAKNLSDEQVVSSVTNLRYFTLGMGSFWGSADVCVDNLMIYNRELSSTDVRALNTMSNRVCDFTIGENGTDVQQITIPSSDHAAGTYDLMGRSITHPTRGLYIHNGKKILVR